MGIFPARFRALRGLSVAMLFGGVLAACSYTGGGIEKPFAQKFTWFSFLNGDDIRAACAAGGLDRYRLVYNGRYDEQVRSYDIAADARGGGLLTTKVRGSQSLTEISSSNPLGPWAWQESQVDLTAAQLAKLESALLDDGFYAPAPTGLRLKSRNFYWTGVGCRDGQVYFHAWVYPDAAFTGLSFPALLAASDQSGRPVNQPRPLPVEARRQGPDRRGGTAPDNNFDLTVGRNGLAGVWTLF